MRGDVGLRTHQQRSGGWEKEPTEIRRFMYDDWRMLLELDDEGDVIRQYT